MKKIQLYIVHELYENGKKREIPKDLGIARVVFCNASLRMWLWPVPSDRWPDEIWLHDVTITVQPNGSLLVSGLTFLPDHETRVFGALKLIPHSMTEVPDDEE